NVDHEIMELKLLTFLNFYWFGGLVNGLFTGPHGSNANSTERPTSPHEPYWQTNTSFSPPPPRWDYRFQSEGNQGIQYGSNESIQLFGSTSSNSKESKNWMRGGYPQTYQSATEAGSPSDTSLVQPWTPPPTQRVNIDDIDTSAKRGAKSGPLCFTPTMEVILVHYYILAAANLVFTLLRHPFISLKGTFMVPNSRGSTSSRSDYSEFEHSGKLHLSTPRNFPSRRSFMSKPIHPLSFPVEAPTLEPSPSVSVGHVENDYFTLQRDAHRLSSGSSSVDLADIAERFESGFLGRSSNPCEGRKCGVCDRLLSHRSPWKSGEMPVTGVLFCGHVFHAECLEQTTPKSHKSDPLCPICTKVELENSPEKRIFLKTHNSFPRLRAFSAGGSSRSWGCVQVGDCVEGALNAPHRSSMLLNRNKIKKYLSLKGNVGKDYPGKPKKNESYPE
ncbi:hypothetical protein KSS87_017698, partial [Heliosperma pusillum]